jgi:hypothetical protein
VDALTSQEFVQLFLKFYYRTASLPHWMRDKELDDLLEMALQIKANN